MTFLDSNFEELLEYEGKIAIEQIEFYQSEKIKIKKAINATLAHLKLQHLSPLLFIQLNRGYLNQIINYYVGCITKYPTKSSNSTNLGALYNILNNNVVDNKFESHLEINLLHQGIPYRNTKPNMKSFKGILKYLLFIILTKVSFARPIKLIYSNNGVLKKELSKISGSFDLRYFYSKINKKHVTIEDFQTTLKCELEKNKFNLDCELVSKAVAIKTGHDAIHYNCFVENLVEFIKKYKVKAVFVTSSGSPNDLALLIAARMNGIKTFFCHHGFSASNNYHLKDLVDVQFSFDDIGQKIPGASIIEINVPWHH